MKNIKPFHQITLIIIALCFAAIVGCNDQKPPQPGASARPEISVGIAPYQDMAMLVNIDNLKLEDKYNLNVNLVSMAWQELTPAVSSAGKSVDIAFASLIQFITQEGNLNKDDPDPIVFFYPAYVFKGGAFVSFNDKVPVIDKTNLDDVEKVREFLSFKIAAQKTSSYEVLLFDLSKRAGLDFSKLDLYDIGAEDGLLAAINGSVDMSSAGLTQKNEALTQGGRVVLEMTALGQVDIAGFIAKKSTLEQRLPDVKKVMKMWVECIDFVIKDLDTNSAQSLAYLKKQSSTEYTIDQYKTALSQELLPRSILEIKNLIVEPTGDFFYQKVVDSFSNYYLQNDIIKERPGNIKFISIE